MAKLVFHVDVNSAYLSWEAARRVANGEPDLRLIPSVIGGDRDKRTGVVLAKSIPAKKFGIKTGEPMGMALRKYPDLAVAKPDFRLYEENSKKFMDICREYAPVVEKASIDECYLDMSGTHRIYPDPVALAHTIKDRIKAELGFTVNIGIGENKLFAKMASDFEKPAAKPHTHAYTSKTTAATCGMAGLTVYTCACGDAYTEELPAMEHDMEMSYTAPTTEAEGVEVATCKRCGYEVRQILEKLPVLATNADASEIEALIIKYINEYRTQEGACAAMWMEGCDVYAQYRSEQMAAKSKADHDRADRLAAAAAVQYGIYTDPSIYGLPGDPYYAVKGQEAVGMDGGGTIDHVAKTLATGFYNSKSHWSYVGDDAHGFISVGVTEKDGRWYCCVVVALVNLDENPAGI